MSDVWVDNMVGGPPVTHDFFTCNWANIALGGFVLLHSFYINGRRYHKIRILAETCAWGCIATATCNLICKYPSCISVSFLTTFHYRCNESRWSHLLCYTPKLSISWDFKYSCSIARQSAISICIHRFEHSRASKEIHATLGSSTHCTLLHFCTLHAILCTTDLHPSYCQWAYGWLQHPSRPTPHPRLCSWIPRLQSILLSNIRPSALSLLFW